MVDKQQFVLYTTLIFPFGHFITAVFSFRIKGLDQLSEVNCRVRKQKSIYKKTRCFELSCLLPYFLRCMNLFVFFCFCLFVCFFACLYKIPLWVWYCWWKQSCSSWWVVYPIIYIRFYKNCQVVQDFFHQQYLRLIHFICCLHIVSLGFFSLLSCPPRPPYLFSDENRSRNNWLTITEAFTEFSLHATSSSLVETFHGFRSQWYLALAGGLACWCLGEEKSGSHRSDGKVESIQRSDVFLGKKDVFAFHVLLFLVFFWRVEGGKGTHVCVSVLKCWIPETSSNTDPAWGKENYQLNSGGWDRGYVIGNPGA